MKTSAKSSNPKNSTCDFVILALVQRSIPSLIKRSIITLSFVLMLLIGAYAYTFAEIHLQEEGIIYYWTNLNMGSDFVCSYSSTRRSAELRKVMDSGAIKITQVSAADFYKVQANYVVKVIDNYFNKVEIMANWDPNFDYLHYA